MIKLLNLLFILLILYNTLNDKIKGFILLLIIK